MAQKVQVILVDDIDGGEADETVTFALDGVSYEIDVSETHAQELRSAMEKFLNYARRTGGRAKRAVANGKAAPVAQANGSEALDLNDVRSWARENGYEVSDRGRVANAIQDAYREAHGL